VVTPGSGRAVGREQSAGGGQQFGTARSMQDRERALHATPVPSSRGQSTFQTDRPGPQVRAEPTPGGRPTPNDRPEDAGAAGASTTGTSRGPVLRNDRPPSSQLRQNDQFRMQNSDDSRRQAQEIRPMPEARPIEPRAVEQPRQMPEARPIEPR